MAVGLGITALNAVSQLFSNYRNRKQSIDAAARSDKYQRDLIRDLPALNKAGYQDAGLSVAALNSGFTSSSSSAAVTPAQDSPVSVDLAAATQAALLPAQTRLANSQADSAKSAAEISKNEAILSDLKTKDEIAKGRYIDALASDNFSPEIGDVVVNGSHSPGWMSTDRYSIVKGLAAKVSKEVTQDSLAAAVAKQQLENPTIVKALSDMPHSEFLNMQRKADLLLRDVKLRNIVDKYSAQIAKNNAHISGNESFMSDIKKYFSEHEKEIEDFIFPLRKATAKAEYNTNASLQVERMFSGDFSFEDAMKFLLTSLAKFVSSGASAAAHKIGGFVGDWFTPSPKVNSGQ